MTHWLIRLVGDQTWLERLSRRTCTEGYEVAKEGNDYFYRADDLDRLADPRDVQRAAEEQIRRLRGMLWIKYGADGELNVGEVRRVAHDGTGTVDAFVTGTIRARAIVSAALRDGAADGAEAPPADDFGRWYGMAQQSDAVAKVLRLMESQPDWVDLVRIREVVDEDLPHGQTVVKAKWVSRTKLEALEHTANSPAAVEDEARHGVQKNTPPTRPMSFAEATAIIKHIVQSWLAAKDASA